MSDVLGFSLSLVPGSTGHEVFGEIWAQNPILQTMNKYYYDTESNAFCKSIESGRPSSGDSFLARMKKE